MGHSAEFVSPSDESTDEAKVDEGYEYGRLAGRLAAEEGGDCPGSGENGDDEQGPVQ